ncbi:vegetative cell wall protein gp1 [Brassica rapa]|uniref:vegetative cell wall protein gp1-like n=1 Tax=Brassica napus TaxID=3708 RepID=UPI0004F19C5C|nr:vegetative cell wall protein gp1-like [Brassica napus]XP_033148580.1 vegetative cell wall protein gp1 [Brassica rapa]
MVNINVAHIKCKVNCTKPLPRSAEIERDNGEIVTVDIDYPWTPPICPCCNEVGHLETHCPSAKWKPSKNVPAKDKPSKAAPSPAVPVPAAPSPPTDCSLVTPVLPPGPSQTDSMAWEPSVTTSEAQALPTASQEVSPNVVDLSTDSGPSVLPGGPSPSLPPIIPHHPFLPTPVSVDGILLTPPSSPPSPPAAVFSQASSENSYSPPSKITHLLALPAVHHSRPINTKFFKKPPSPSHSLPPSKSILSLNPFACLALQSSTPSTVTESAPSLDPPPLSPPSFTSITPAVGSFLSEGETHNL